MSAETDIAAIDDGGRNTAAEVRTALTSILARADGSGLAPPSSPHTDDDEFDDDTKTGFTEVAASGTATWTESSGVLSCKFEDQSTSDLAAALKSLTPTSAPVTIESAIRLLSRHEVNPMAGIGFTDGTATTDKVAGTRIGLTDTVGVWRLSYFTGTIDNATATSNVLDFAIAGVGPLYMRFIWTAANTFKYAFSPDGVSWTDFDVSSSSNTMTPTHFGAIVTSWGSTFQSVATYEYLRVVESDLSV